MNGWYGAAIAGVVLLTEGLINLIANKRKKLEWRSDAIRASSGGFVLVLAYLSIHFEWFGADIIVSYNPFYSLSFAGFVLLLESFFSYILNVITKQKRESSINTVRFWTGFGIFALGLLILIMTGG